MMLIFAFLLANADDCTVSPGDRTDCGYSGIDQQGCVAKKCCWGPVQYNLSAPFVPWCFYPKGVAPKTTPPPADSCPLPGCDIFHHNQCEGNVVETDAKFEKNRWYTPTRGSNGWKKSYQDFSELTFVPELQYTPARDGLTVTLQAIQRANGTLSYEFDGKSQTASSKKFTASDKSPINAAVTDSGKHRVQLDPLDFMWNAPKLPELKGDYRNGQKGAIVEFFGWPHKDIEQECAFLAKAGFLGAKVFPAQEQIMSDEPFNGVLNPWYFMYQPVSYRLQGRMGTRDELRKMIHTCRSQGVRLYADAVVNHMTGNGNDGNPEHRNPSAGCTKWGAKGTSISESATDGPSPMYTQGYLYTCNKRTGLEASLEFPAAGYGPTDFHCERVLNSWTDPLMLNAGWLTGLTDLNTEKQFVQNRIANYFVDLISIGFSGFRIDAAKHIQPDDLVAIFTLFRMKVGGTLPDDFIAWLEVILGGESDLLMCNPESGYNYGKYLEDKLKNAGWSMEDINKIKIWNSGYPKESDKGYCTISPVRNAIQNDDADQQNPGSSSRDMGPDGCVLIKGCDENTHRNFEVKLFESPNGIPDNANDAPIRLVLSSYYFGNGGTAQGLPDGKSDCSLCKVNCDGCAGMAKAAAYDASSTGYDKPVYTRVHRDQTIVNAMRKWMGLGTLNSTELYQ